jgi:hypothetical protein
MMQLVIAPGGEVRCVYGEDLDLAMVGEVEVRRASHVEPDGRGGWRADLSPVGGPRLGPFSRRSAALQAETAWLEQNWLASGTNAPLPSLKSQSNHRKEGVPCSTAGPCSR